MQISSIKEHRSAKSIQITYKLNEVDCLVQFRLPDCLINFRQFSEMYLRIDQPFKYFDLVYAKSGFIKIIAFRGAMTKLQKKPVASAEMKVVEELIDNLDSIEEDLKYRLIIVSLLPLNPKFDKDDKETLKIRIKSIDDKVRKNVKNINPQWQLLYVVATTIKQIWNGEEKCIIKLGKTNKPIEEYIPHLRENYQNRVDFQALFAQRLYTPGNTLIDTKHFHNKLLTQIPESKIYFQANDNDDDLHLHYEFYFLTKDFVDTFEKLLWNFIETHKTEYSESHQAVQFQQNINKSDSENDESDSVTVAPQQHQTTIKDKNQNLSLSYEPILNNLKETTYENDQSADQNDTIHNFTQANMAQNNLNQINLKNSNDSNLRIPLAGLSENGAKLIFESLKMTKSKNPLLAALLYMAQAEREQICNFQEGD